MAQIHSSEELLEVIIKATVKELNERGDLRCFFVALHNSFAHGTIVPEVTNEDLETMFKHFEGLIDIAKKYE